MSDLDKLIDAVEGGDWSGSWRSVIDAGIDAPRFNGAYHGSLDAAKALHDALLTGWIGYADTSGFCFMYEDEREENESSALIPGNPARAWLIAILKAYRAQQETEQ